MNCSSCPAVLLGSKKCKVGVYSYTLKSGKVGCCYNMRQINCWMKNEPQVKTKEPPQLTRSEYINTLGVEDKARIFVKMSLCPTYLMQDSSSFGCISSCLTCWIRFLGGHYVRGDFSVLLSGQERPEGRK